MFLASLFISYRLVKQFTTYSRLPVTKLPRPRCWLLATDFRNAFSAIFADLHGFAIDDISPSPTRTTVLVLFSVQYLQLYMFSVQDVHPWGCHAPQISATTLRFASVSTFYLQLRVSHCVHHSPFAETRQPWGIAPIELSRKLLKPRNAFLFFKYRCGHHCLGDRQLWNSASNKSKCKTFPARMRAHHQSWASHYNLYTSEKLRLSLPHGENKSRTSGKIRVF